MKSSSTCLPWQASSRIQSKRLVGYYIYGPNGSCAYPTESLSTLLLIVERTLSVWFELELPAIVLRCFRFSINWFSMKHLLPSPRELHTTLQSAGQGTWPQTWKSLMWLPPCQEIRPVDRRRYLLRARFKRKNPESRLVRAYVVCGLATALLTSETMPWITDRWFMWVQEIQTHRSVAATL